MNSRSFIALLALCAGLPGLARAGVYVEMADRKAGSTETKLVQKMYIQGTSGRFVDVSDRGEGNDSTRETATLIKDGTLYAIDDEDKSYVMLDKASMDQLGKKLSAGIEQMREQLSKMPEEQRAQMEQMLAKQIPGFSTGQKWSVESVDTGETDKVDGRSCHLWDVKRNGELDEQLCVVPFAALPGKENFQAVFGNFAKVFEEMAKTVPMLAGLMSNEFAAQEKINGFPVRSRDYENGKLSDVERVMRVWREESVPASMFQVPAGYKKKAMEDLAGL
ncbi:MAG TPA: DUF4412 domain-containing protein [Steroidobacteraceae bacterium]|nr:DUF4412 domain-containing protein [Steroidobacteraceae bacterium]